MQSETIQQALTLSKTLLSKVSDNPTLESEILLSHAIQKSRIHLHAWANTILNEEQSKVFAEYVQRRCNNEPIAYIIGCREFWSLNLSVTRDTLIPRPETELLVECVLDVFGETNKQIKLADLGTGSGAIALALAHEKLTWQIYATDISENALQTARKNAQQLALENLSFYLGDWCTALPCRDFDVIVSNPPYIAEVEWEAYAKGLEFEPHHALVSGLDGLDSIRIISQTAKSYLKPSGYVFVEHGFLQGEAVRNLFASSGYSQVRTVLDLSGKERVTICQL